MIFYGFAYTRPPSRGQEKEGWGVGRVCGQGDVHVDGPLICLEWKKYLAGSAPIIECDEIALLLSTHGPSLHDKMGGSKR